MRSFTPSLVSPPSFPCWKRTNNAASSCSEQREKPALPELSQGDHSHGPSCAGRARKGLKQRGRVPPQRSAEPGDPAACLPPPARIVSTLHQALIRAESQPEHHMGNASGGGERLGRASPVQSPGPPSSPTAPGARCQGSILAGGRSCCREPEQRAALGMLLQPAGMLSSTRTMLWVQPGTGAGLRGEGHAGAKPIRQPRGAPQKAVLEHDAVSPTLTCLVATSERFRRVQRQFCTSLGLELVRCLPKACMPPARETRHRAAYKYPDMQSVPSGEEKGATAALSTASVGWMPPDCCLQRTTSPCGLAEAKCGAGRQLPARQLGRLLPTHGPRKAPQQAVTGTRPRTGGFTWPCKASERPARQL